MSSGITYTLRKRFYKDLCRRLKTRDKNKIIFYLNKTLGLRQTIKDIKLK